MEAPLKLALVLLLVAGTSFGHNAPQVVRIQCSLIWFKVDFQALTLGDWYVLPDEVFLGYGCPVTDVQQDIYMFAYPTSDCGIKTRILKGKIVFKTVLAFISKTSTMQGIMPITCTLHQDRPSSWPARVFIDPRQSKSLIPPMFQTYFPSLGKYL